MSIYYIFIIFLTISYYLLDNNYTLCYSNKKILRIKKNELFGIFACLGLICIFGLRDVSVGVDTTQYHIRYEIAPYMLDIPSYQTEFGFNYLNYLFYSFGVSFQLYLFVIYSFISIVTVRFLCKYSKNVLLSIFLYITIGNFTMAMSGLRQTLAITIILIATELILEKKNIAVYIITVLLAYTIHNSAIIFLPVYLLGKLKLQRNIILITLITCILALVYRSVLPTAVTLFLPERYTAYSLDSDYNMNPLVILVSILIPAFCLLVNNNIDSTTGKYNQITTTFFLYSCINVFFTILTLNSNQLGRIAYYFSISNMILIPMALDSIKDRLTKNILGIIIIAFCFAYFAVSTSGGTLQIDNYKFFWQ